MQAQLCQVHRFSHVQDKTVLTALPVSYGFCGAGAASVPFHTTQQVHGTRIVPATSQTHWDNHQFHPSADGLYTRADETIAVKTADCLPLLIAHYKGSIVMAVHAGWKGLAAGIVQEAIQLLLTEYSFRVSELRVLIGPAISQGHFEVGPEVVRAFFGPSQLFDLCDKELLLQPSREDRVCFDLPNAAALCLLRQGLHHEHLSVMDSCTYQHDSMWHSFRREKQRPCRSNYTWIKSTSFVL